MKSVLRAKRTMRSTPKHSEAKHSDRGDARTKTLASLVGVMIAAAVVALLFVAFDSSSSSASDSKHDAGGQPAARNTHSAPQSVTPTTAPSNKPSKSSKPTTGTSSKPKPTTKSSPVADSSSSRSHSTSAKKVVYTVKKGDNLTIIAAWFHQHGYGNLYQRNKSVIGNNPNLIHPGQKIVIGNGGRMTAKNN